jgi:hypothetical protein
MMSKRIFDPAATMATNTWFTTILCCLLLLCRTNAIAQSQPEIQQQQQHVTVVSDYILDMSAIAAELSNLAYDNNAVSTNDSTVSGYYRITDYFRNEPDVAIVAASEDGICYVAFRGTVPTISDWSQNMGFALEPICSHKEVNAETTCCRVRRNFWDAYDSPFRYEMEAAIRECLSTETSCTDESSNSTTRNSNETCLVLTGHSQGGAIAAVAGLKFAEFDPYVISFGQPTVINEPESCSLVHTERWYRYVNTDTNSDGEIRYDVVPMIQGVRTSHVGHMILLPPVNNATSIAYWGLDVPEPWLSPVSVAAHFMDSYEDRLQELVMAYPYIQVDGFDAGVSCSDDRECASNRCDYEYDPIENMPLGPKQCIEI